MPETALGVSKNIVLIKTTLHIVADQTEQTKNILRQNSEDDIRKPYRDLGRDQNFSRVSGF